MHAYAHTHTVLDLCCWRNRCVSQSRALKFGAPAHHCACALPVFSRTSVPLSRKARGSAANRGGSGRDVGMSRTEGPGTARQISKDFLLRGKNATVSLNNGGKPLLKISIHINRIRACCVAQCGESFRWSFVVAVSFLSDFNYNLSYMD